SNLVFDPFAPHYNFNEFRNKIALSSSQDNIARFITGKGTGKIKANLRQQPVEAFLSAHELPKIILLEYLDKGKAEKLISDFMMINNSSILNIGFIENIKSKLADLVQFNKKSQGRKQLDGAYKPEEKT